MFFLSRMMSEEPDKALIIFQTKPMLSACLFKEIRLEYQNVILHVTFIVTQTWCMQNSKDNRLYDKDFKRLNKMCTFNKITTAIDQNLFRKSIEVRI